MSMYHGSWTYSGAGVRDYRPFDEASDLSDESL
jgi:hypothetical protein